MSRKLTLDLPWPPSVNMYWTRTRSGGMCLSKKARSFRDSVQAILWADQPESFGKSRLGVEIELRRRDRHQFDVDNFAKGILDSLVYAGLFDDDEQVDELRVTRGPTLRPVGGCRITIWVIAD